jgi:hypothetical protein
MLPPPRRFWRGTEHCPACDRAIGELRTFADGGKSLRIDQGYYNGYNRTIRKFEIICACGCHILWQGEEVRSIKPVRDAA